jgi:hypothetical protein
LFTFGKLNTPCCFTNPFRSTSCTCTALGVQRKFGLIGGVAPSHRLVYSSKWWLAMWPRHVEFEPRRKHALSDLVGRPFLLSTLSVSALDCHVSNHCSVCSNYSLAKHTPSALQQFSHTCSRLLEHDTYLKGEDSQEIACRVLLGSDCCKSFPGLVLVEVLWIQHGES